jgi:hypothetical protein
MLLIQFSQIFKGRYYLNPAKNIDRLAFRWIDYITMVLACASDTSYGHKGGGGGDESKG